MPNRTLTEVIDALERTINQADPDEQAVGLQRHDLPPYIEELRAIASRLEQPHSPDSPMVIVLRPELATRTNIVTTREFIRTVTGCAATIWSDDTNTVTVTAVAPTASFPAVAYIYDYHGDLTDAALVYSAEQWAGIVASQPIGYRVTATEPQH